MKLGYFSIHQTITEYLQGWLIIIQTLIMTSTKEFDGLVQERRNSGALATELCFSCTDPWVIFGSLWSCGGWCTYTILGQNGIHFTEMATSNRGSWVNAALQFLVWFSFDFGRHTEWQFDKCTSKPEATDAMGVRTPGLTANYSCSYNDIPRWAVIGCMPTGSWPHVYIVYVMMLLITPVAGWNARPSAAKQLTYNYPCNWLECHDISSNTVYL